MSEPFIGAARPTLPSLAASLGLGGLRNIFKIDFHRSMWKALGDFFKDPTQRQVFNDVSAPNAAIVVNGRS